MPQTDVPNPLLSFEHKILRALDQTGRVGWLVAVSGGVDSVVLAEVFRRWRQKLCVRLVLAHVHHGRGPAHRDDARALVGDYARAHRLPFVSNAPDATGPTDEAALRRLRFGHLERWRIKYGLNVIALGHHRDDLLETRLLRLIRGTGPRGVTAMTARRGTIARPLLDVTRAEIEAYARARGLAWIEDPSNADPSVSARAWIRHRWLPELEKRQPGASGALARSLAQLGAGVPAVDHAWARSAGVRRAAFTALDRRARARVVSEYLTALGTSDVTTGQVLEIVKRLDSSRKDFTFRIRGVDIYVGAHAWWASRVCE